jgi:hypothetical protein
VVISSIAILATPAGAAASAGPFELSGASPAIKIPTLYSVSQSINQHPSGSAYGSGGAPRSESQLSITAPLDQTGTSLSHATALGTHYKSGSLLLQSGGTPYEAICLTDAYVTSFTQGSSGGGGGTPTMSATISSGKIAFKYGTGASCSGVSSPSVESKLVGINRSASIIRARVDCLTARCRGILSVSLPNSACPAVASPSSLGGTGGKCSFTGGVRVGLNGGKVSFNGDGTAFTGGVKVGIGGAGKFSMGDGSVRVLKLSVPPPLRKWLKGHSHPTLGSIIVVHGLGRAIVEREVLGAPAKIYAGIPSLNEPPGGSGPGPQEQAQSLLVTECSTPVVGVPSLTEVRVNGSLSPPRGGATVTLTYTPVNGPMPLPSPVIHTVTTTATGAFGENFEREVGGNPYSWNVVASIAAGDGYAAASSPACPVPSP